MFSFFDSLYYAVYLWYCRQKESSAQFSASCFVSGFQTFNILAFIFPLYFLIPPGIHFSKWIAGSLIIALMIFNYFRYVYFDDLHLKIKEWWDTLPSEKQKNIITLNWRYCTISVLALIACIGLRTYLNSKH
jgi:hypothetical protein